MRIASFTDYRRKSVSLIVLATFVALLHFCTTPAPASISAGNSETTIAQMDSGGSGFIEHESKLTPVIKKERKFPWLIVGLGVVAVGIAVYFMVKKKSAYTLADDVDKNAVKILFIGSSYLGFHDLTGMFYRLAIEKNKNIFIDTRIVYGQDLSILSSDSKVIEKIFARKWDYVILQGVSHTISEEKWHNRIVPYIISLKNNIAKNCAATKTIYMMGWGYEDGLLWMAGETEDYFELQTNICNQSVRLAKENNFSIAPVGWAWYQVIKEKPEIKLFSADLNHQTLTGSYLSACVFYATIFKEPLNGINYKAGLETKLAFYLQKIASETVLNGLEKWNLK